MARRPTVDLFCEDAGHEAFIRALLPRVATEAGVPRPNLNVRSARGGHGRAITELNLWQKTLLRGASGADLLMVVIDANGEGWPSQRRAIQASVQEGLFPNLIIACPDPHVEAWIAADEGAFRRAFGADPPPPPGRPGRDAYKRWLRRALEAVDVEVLTDAMSVSDEIVQKMDLFAAGKASPSFRAMMQDLSGFFHRYGAEG